MGVPRPYRRVVPAVTARITRALSAPTGRSLASAARARRWEAFGARYPDFRSMRVLDLGGVPDHWTSAPLRPAQVTIVNLEDHADQGGADWIDTVVGDACALPAPLRGGFDLVFSNSVIEHVGGYEQRCRFADSVQAAADRWWIQTPYRYFPVEPHWLFPGFQFLPLAARSWLTRTWPLGHMRTGGAAAVDQAARVELLTATELRQLLPGSDLWRERFAGLVKSIVAVR